MPRDLNPEPRLSYPCYAPYSCREDWEDANPGREAPRYPVTGPSFAERYPAYDAICTAQTEASARLRRRLGSMFDEREESGWVPNRDLLEG
jgi:hypothetical protein